VNVVIVPFFTWFLTKKKIELKSMISAILTLVGIGFLTLDDSLSVNLGDMLTLICAIMFAAHISLTSQAAREDSANTLVFIQMLTATILSLIFTLILREDTYLNLSSFLAIIYLGAFCTMLAFVLQTAGQKYAHPSKAAIFLATESLFGAIFAVIFFHDPLNFQMILGGLIIFIAIFITESNIKFNFFKQTN
jgi:drug/metabolite transporter (DMT)-like permease